MDRGRPSHLYDPEAPCPQPNTKTKYRPLPAALLTLVVLLASTLHLAGRRAPQLGKGRTETLAITSTLGAAGRRRHRRPGLYLRQGALHHRAGVLPGAQPQGELEVVLSDADTGEELALLTGVMQNIILTSTPPWAGSP